MKILLAFDGSEGAKLALKFALRFRYPELNVGYTNNYKFSLK